MVTPARRVLVELLSIDRKRMSNNFDGLPEWCNTLPDWSCYRNHPDYNKATVELNMRGLELVMAIRDLKGSVNGIRHYMKQLVECQEKWTKVGADDTEGREALWSLVNRACEDTAYDPEKLFKLCYIR